VLLAERWIRARLRNERFISKRPVDHPALEVKRPLTWAYLARSGRFERPTF
jgi:hypothetical protein